MSYVFSFMHFSDFTFHILYVLQSSGLLNQILYSLLFSFVFDSFESIEVFLAQKINDLHPSRVDLHSSS
jgi:hypothetical protein